MISHPSRHCTVELQALPSRIGQVRRIVSAQLRYWHMDALIDRAALGVTELLSNVHRHARPDKSCTVELELAPDRLTVSVRDNDPRLPVPADVADLPDGGPLATCGRGLAMVAAVSESWGARPDGENGKVVWFTLTAPAVVRPYPAHVPRRAAAVRPAPEPVRVGTAAKAPAGTRVGAGVTLTAEAPAAAAPVANATTVATASPAPAGAGPQTPARSTVPG
ncbi:ATP-binding protein [Streptomyces incarnatus]|uniref:ATP-binding protein n=1 Tax=Streptomyces incarnatus TaxID=665007 RepID=UPI000AB2528E|nr:ATP-binding protein [Streptomyces incarnatus]